MYNLNYANGNPSQSPSQYFSLQLISNGVVIAQTIVPSWGLSPGSIYVSSSSLVVWGDNYQIRLIGSSLFSNPISYTYSTTSSDWAGPVIPWIDSWVRSTADSMYQMNGIPLSQYSTGNNWVLNNQGGNIFTSSIPGLNIVRPMLFLSKPGFSLSDIPAPTSTYSPTDIGSITRNAFNNLSINLGLGAGHGSYVSGFVWLMFMMIVCGIVVFATNVPSLGIVFIIPMLIGGVVLGLISMQVMAAIGLMASFAIGYAIFGRTG